VQFAGDVNQGYLVYSSAFESARPTSEQVPFKWT